MSDQTHVNEPTIPPPPQEEISRKYVDLDAKTGVFKFEIEKGRGEKVPQIQGYYKAHWIEWSCGNDEEPGSKNYVGPRWVMRLVLARAKSTKNRNAELPVGEALITIAAKVPFASIGEQLVQVKPGSYLSFEANLSGDATLINTALWDGMDWTYLRTPASNGVAFDDRYISLVERLIAHPGYRQLETPPQPKEGATWKARIWGSEFDATQRAALVRGVPVERLQTSAADPNPTGGSAQGAAGASTSAASGASAATASSGNDPKTGLPPGAVPEGKEAFGYPPGRWPKAEDWDTEQAANVFDAIRKRAKVRGVGIVVTPGDEMIGSGSAEQIRNAIARAYGVAELANRGTAMLAYDFLQYADEEQVESLRQTLAAPKNVPAADEHDPFAEA